MKLYVLLFLLLSVISITGCDKAKSLTNSDVSLVKTGTLEFDKSLTVGQAIDKYRYFKKTDWELLKEDNGRRVVQTTADIDVMKHPDINPAKIPELKSAFYKFQFVINQDKTFQLGWCGFGAEKTDGSKIEPDKSVNLIRCINTLKEIYANEVGEVPVIPAPQSKTPETSQPSAPATNAVQPAATPAPAPQVVKVNPSFDCGKASTATERLICSSNELAQADVQLAQAYKAALGNAADKAALKKEQAAWLKNQRNVCTDANTMLKAYQERTSQLSK